MARAVPAVPSAPAPVPALPAWHQWLRSHPHPRRPTLADASASSAVPGDLARRVDVLERRLGQLEQRLGELDRLSIRFIAIHASHMCLQTATNPPNPQCHSFRQQRTHSPGPGGVNARFHGRRLTQEPPQPRRRTGRPAWHRFARRMIDGDCAAIALDAYVSRGFVR